MPKKETGALMQQMERALNEVVTFGQTDAEHLGQLAAPINALGISSYMGRIAFAGQRSNGNFTVQFNADGGSGYSSDWPEWAFNQAQVALLHGKKVWVISNGSPFGNNLMTVLVMSTAI